MIAFVFEGSDVPLDLVLADGAAILGAASEEHPEFFEHPEGSDLGCDFTVSVREGAGLASFDLAGLGNIGGPLKARAFLGSIVDGALAGTPRVLNVVARPDAGTAIATASWLLEQLASSVSALAPSLASKEGPAVSPQVAYVLAEEELDLRAIEEEFGWLDSGGVAEQMGKKRNRTLASGLRAKGQLLGYARRGQQALRYPKFQFDEKGILPVIPQLIRIADGNEVAHEDLLFWFCAPSGMLKDDARPVDVLRADPDGVLDAARYDLGRHSW